VEQDGSESDKKEESLNSTHSPITAADSDTTAPTSDSNGSPGSKQDADDVEIEMTKITKIKETVKAFKKTSNHIDVMDIYRIFVAELCKEDTELGKEILSRKEHVAKLVPDQDHHSAMQVRNVFV